MEKERGSEKDWEGREAWAGARIGQEPAGLQGERSSLTHTLDR